MDEKSFETRFILLDGMRGLAAIEIVAFHLWLPEKPFFSGFNTFVDSFFVLSGFVLAPKIMNLPYCNIN